MWLAWREEELVSTGCSLARLRGVLRRMLYMPAGSLSISSPHPLFIHDPSSYCSPPSGLVFIWCAKSGTVSTDLYSCRSIDEKAGSSCQK